MQSNQLRRLETSLSPLPSTSTREGLGRRAASHYAPYTSKRAAAVTSYEVSVHHITKQHIIDISHSSEKMTSVSANNTINSQELMFVSQDVTNVVNNKVRIIQNIPIQNRNPILRQLLSTKPKPKVPEPINSIPLTIESSPKTIIENNPVSPDIFSTPNIQSISSPQNILVPSPRSASTELSPNEVNPPLLCDNSFDHSVCSYHYACCYNMIEDWHSRGPWVVSDAQEVLRFVLMRREMAASHAKSAHPRLLRFLDEQIEQLKATVDFLSRNRFLSGWSRNF